MVSVSKVKVRRQEGTKNVSGPTGIPGAVQAKFETASRLSFEDVRVHYNSPRPAQLGAYAYTQGSQVYIGPGQERHLEHELGHVIQQKQGIVKADGYINGVPVNRDPGLERAADQGANQPVQGFWKSLSGVVQMKPPGEEEEEEEEEEGAEAVGGPEEEEDWFSSMLLMGGDSEQKEQDLEMKPVPTPEATRAAIQALPEDGIEVSCDTALRLAQQFIGQGYTEPVEHSGRYVSADQARVVRMGENDILGRHGKSPDGYKRHVNFEVLQFNPDRPDKPLLKADRHVFLTDYLEEKAIIDKMKL